MLSLLEQVYSVQKDWDKRFRHFTGASDLSISLTYEPEQGASDLAWNGHVCLVLLEDFTLYSERIGGVKGVGIKNNRYSHFNVIFPAVQAAYDVLITDDAHEHQLWLT